MTSFPNSRITANSKLTSEEAGNYRPLVQSILSLNKLWLIVVGQKKWDSDKLMIWEEKMLVPWLVFWLSCQRIFGVHIKSMEDAVAVWAC